MLNKKALIAAGAGLALFAAYKYSKLSTDQKKDLRNSLKEKGRSFADKIIPENIKTKFSQAEAEGSFKPGF